jgi:hypothetical protein
MSGKWQLIDCLTDSNCLKQLSALTAWIHIQLQPMLVKLELSEEASNLVLRGENIHHISLQ